MRALLLLFWSAALLVAADREVYWALWFDTEDYIAPAADDATLRLAVELETLGVRATFKIVGEKARVLERRGRRDVIRALARHDIGYHAENHSIPPPPAMYLRLLGMDEGAAEFERREGQGVRDLQRIFGVTPSCYGQPGSSWGPQSNVALRRLGIPVYMDEGSQVGLDNQPFWFMGVLHVFRLGPYALRANLDDESKLEDTKRLFSERVAELKRRGGGVLHTYYHPTEFVATEFWDAVNFPRGRYTPPGDYRLPGLRSHESAERAYRIFLDFVRHAKSTGVRIVTGRDWPQLMESPVRPLEASQAKRWLAEAIDVRGEYSAADQLLAVLGIPPRLVDGPAQRVASTLRAPALPRHLFERGKQDAAGYLERHGRLPSHVWFGAEYLSLADFAATAAGDEGGAEVRVRRGVLAFERFIAADPRKAFTWAIHPDNFEAPELLELGRLQAWTLKAARLK